MAEKICTHCGYEGKGKVKKGAGGGIARVLGIVTMLPFHTIWKLLFAQRGSNECPNCHLPTLVKLNSDAGVVARRKFDIELGFIKPIKKEENADPVASFGNQTAAETPKVKKPVDPEQW